MGTPWPLEPALLPPHHALPLSSIERAALGPVVWAPVGEEGGEEGVSPEGYWNVWPNGEEMDGTYAVFFTPNVSEERQEELTKLYQGEPGTVEHSLLRAHLWETELGYTLNATLAKEWVEQMRSTGAGLEKEKVLADAGFALTVMDAPVGRQYEKAWGSGVFTLCERPYGYHLVFRDGRKKATALCRVRFAKKSHQNTAIPTVWPTVVAVPHEIGLRVALAAAAAYEQSSVPAQPRVARRKRLV